jgi:hypothetical protein
MGEHRMREIDAGGEPADRIGIVAVRSPSHEVSIRGKTGVGRCLGCEPRLEHLDDDHAAAKLLRPCVAALDELARNYRTTAVLCSGKV